MHVTNGDVAAKGIRESGLGGSVLAWKDVLHEGPVPARASTPELMEIRARFLSSCGWTTLEAARSSLEERDAALEAACTAGPVVLWFEHDLYDQLQLLQILDRRAAGELGSPDLALICIGEFPGIEPFYGLGQLTGEQLASLWTRRRPVSEKVLSLARRSWRAFREGDPGAIQACASEVSVGLPFLAPALRRQLQELPATRNGLARSEQQALEELLEGPQLAGRLFSRAQAREESVFMGDLSFWRLLDGLAAGPHPLLELDGGASAAHRVARLTGTGARVLDGELDQVAINGVDRWWGGLHLTGTAVPWRWSELHQVAMNGG